MFLGKQNTIVLKSQCHSILPVYLSKTRSLPRNLRIFCSCTVNQKCCFNGCDYICTPGVPEKPGRAKKCCPTSCGHACRQP
uniref:WAP domain-containing protein n=1 Tax=Xiphophorus maculatus TaxID=8083 RepID=A0A3B5QH44_XIPMA